VCNLLTSVVLHFATKYEMHLSKIIHLVLPQDRRIHLVHGLLSSLMTKSSIYSDIKFNVPWYTRLYKNGSFGKDLKFVSILSYTIVEGTAWDHMTPSPIESRYSLRGILRGGIIYISASNFAFRKAVTTFIWWNINAIIDRNVSRVVIGMCV